MPYEKMMGTQQTPPTVRVIDAGGNYNDLAYAVIDVNNTSLGTPTFTYFLARDTTFASPLPGAPAVAGSYVVVASYAGSVNYTSASASASFPILSGAQQASLLIGTINNLISSGVLSSQAGNALTTKLNQAAASFTAGNFKACIGQVGAFINQVNADMNSGKLSPAEGQILIAASDVIIASA